MIVVFTYCRLDSTDHLQMISELQTNLSFFILMFWFLTFYQSRNDLLPCIRVYHILCNSQSDSSSAFSNSTRWRKPLQRGKCMQLKIDQIHISHSLVSWPNVVHGRMVFLLIFSLVCCLMFIHKLNVIIHLLFQSRRLSQVRWCHSGYDQCWMDFCFLWTALHNCP